MKDGSVVETESGGNWVRNPWCGLVNRANDDLAKYGGLLGLDPTSRTRIKVERSGEQSRREKLLA
jgi:phage terminase small subunit